MFILLTDVLTCPRCGPEMGLIVLADEIEARRVRAGRLGCPNCRASYPVRDGVADLRLPGPAAPPPPADPGTAAGAGDGDDAAVRIAALLGLADAAGLVLAAGHPPALAGAVSALVPAVEVVSVRAAAGDGEPPEGVSAVLAGVAVPFRDGSFRGVALRGGGPVPLAEGLRVAAPGTRLVVEDAPPGTADGIARAGGEVLLDQDGVVVARVPARTGRGRGR